MLREEDGAGWERSREEEPRAPGSWLRRGSILALGLWVLTLECLLLLLDKPSCVSTA